MRTEGVGDADGLSVGFGEGEPVGDLEGCWLKE